MKSVILFIQLWTGVYFVQRSSVHTIYNDHAAHSLTRHSRRICTWRW